MENKRKWVVVTSNDIMIQGRFISESYEEAIGKAYLIANDLFDEAMNDVGVSSISELKRLEGDTGFLIEVSGTDDNSVIYILEVEG